MQVLIAVLCLLAYIGGLILLVRITPRLIKSSYDDAIFIGIAAAAVFGAMLIFGAVGVLSTIFSGVFAVRALNVVLMFVLFFVTLRVALRTLRPNYQTSINSQRISRILTGCFFLFLTAITVYVLYLLFFAS